MQIFEALFDLFRWNALQGHVLRGFASILEYMENRAILVTDDGLRWQLLDTLLQL